MNVNRQKKMSPPSIINFNPTYISGGLNAADGFKLHLIPQTVYSDRVYYAVGSTAAISNYDFYYDVTNNIWVDEGTADPYSFSYSASPIVAGTNIFGEDVNGTTIFSFAMPSLSLFSNQGGITTQSTGGSTALGSIGRIGDLIVISIDKNSPSSSSSVSYDIQKDGVSQGPGISHTSNATTDFLQNLTFAPGIWRLWYQDGNDDELLDYFNASDGRKRHGNFW